MNERVLAIVNLIAQYVIGSEETPVNEKELIAELMSAGFAADEIDNAFLWMESVTIGTSESREKTDYLLSDPGYRIFTTQEQQLLTLEARGFLVRVRSMGLLPDPVQEEIIDRAINAAEEPVTEQEIKLITIMTLLTRSNDIWLREIDCFLENDWQRIYH
ncbi:MAG: DUF494 family protein [Pelovirga sp.]